MALIEKPLEIDYISFSGFKSIESLERFKAGRINILIGSNRTRKFQNFVNVFSFLNEVREGRLQEYVRRAGGAEQLLHFGSKKTDEISFKFSFGQEVNSYELVLARTADDFLSVPIKEVASFWNKSHPGPYFTSLFPSDACCEAGVRNPIFRGTESWSRPE